MDQAASEYLEHLDQLPLAANMAPFLPHSMLRIEVMGLARQHQPPAHRHRVKAHGTGILEEALGRRLYGHVY